MLKASTLCLQKYLKARNIYVINKYFMKGLYKRPGRVGDQQCLFKLNKQAASGFIHDKYTSYGYYIKYI